MGETTRCPCGKRNCRMERFLWRNACKVFTDVAAGQDFPRFMRYARRVKGYTGTAKDMRALLDETFGREWRETPVREESRP